MNSCISFVLVGVEPRPRRVEVFASGGGPSAPLVGLPDAEVRGAQGRVRLAIESSEFTFPGRRVVLNPEESTLVLERHVVEAIAYRGQP